MWYVGKRGEIPPPLTTQQIEKKSAVLQYHHLQLYAEKVAARGLCAIAQCESLRYKLIGGLAVRRYKLDKSVLSITF